MYVACALCKQFRLQLGAVFLKHFKVTAAVMSGLKQVECLENVMRQRSAIGLLKLRASPHLRF